MTQFARPDADVSTGTWTTTPLWSKIDEVSADDTDFIQSSTNADACEVSLTNVTDPVSSSSHILRWRRRASGAPSCTVALYQSTTLIASFTDTGISAGFADQSYTLSGSEADAITDYTDLRIRFTLNVAVNWRCSQAYFECPDTPAAERSRPAQKVQVAMPVRALRI